LSLSRFGSLAGTLYFLSDFESARQYAMRGVQIRRSGGVQSYAEDLHSPAVSCLGYLRLSEWHLGEIASSQAMMTEAISLAKELNDTNALTHALQYAAVLCICERNTAELDRLASELIELSTRHNFVYWLAIGTILRGWARSASGDTAKGIPAIEDGIGVCRIGGEMLDMPLLLTPISPDWKRINNLFGIVAADERHGSPCPLQFRHENPMLAPHALTREAVELLHPR
jgi:hypothetical protein